MQPKARKLLILGFRSVGKSSLAIQYAEGHFVDAYEPTIENTFSKMERIRGQEYALTVVDTAGQDEYSLFSQYYAVDVHGYILVYSINSRRSFEVIKVIHEKLLDMTGNNNVPLVVVGNKTDLHMDRAVPTEEGKRLADSWNAVFLEASAKKDESVADIFRHALNQIEKLQGPPPPKPSSCTVA